MWKVGNGDSDDEDLDVLRAAALQSLKNKAQEQPKWSAVGGRLGSLHPMTGAMMFGSTGGNGYNQGEAVWHTAPLINRSNLISIIPMVSNEAKRCEPKRELPKETFKEKSAISHIEQNSKTSQPESSGPSKFDRIEHSNSEESEEEEEEDDGEKSEAADDADVILMQDEDSLTKFLDEFEQELQDEKDKSAESKEQKPSKNIQRKKSPRSSPVRNYKNNSPLRRRSMSPRRRPLRKKSPSMERKWSPHPRYRSPASPRPLRRNMPPYDKEFRRSRSPLPRLRSPLPRSRSPRLRSRSPRPRSRSPLLRSRSPRPRSRSPILRSRSPLPRARSPLSHHVRKRKKPVRRHSPVNKSRSSSLSLSLSPPRTAESRRHVAPLSISQQEPIKKMSNKPKIEYKKELSPKVSESSEVIVKDDIKSKVKERSDQESSQEPIEENTVLAARRRKFQSSTPIQVQTSKVIRLSSKNEKIKFDVPQKTTEKSPEPESTSKEAPRPTEDVITRDSKGDDLRAELRRRRAERLIQSGNMHHILPTRLVQSALHGLVSKASTLQKRKTQSKKLESKSSGRSEGRRVMVVHKQDDSGEEANLEPDKEEEVGAKGPIHLRLGGKSRHKNKGEKGKKLRLKRSSKAEKVNSGISFNFNIFKFLIPIIS